MTSSITKLWFPWVVIAALVVAGMACIADGRETEPGEVDDWRQQSWATAASDPFATLDVGVDLDGTIRGRRLPSDVEVIGRLTDTRNRAFVELAPGVSGTISARLESVSGGPVSAALAAGGSVLGGSVTCASVFTSGSGVSRRSTKSRSAGRV